MARMIKARAVTANRGIAAMGAGLLAITAAFWAQSLRAEEALSLIHI